MTARYEQIATHLRSLVASAAPGDRLPSEAELCEQFGVSRMTARQAIQTLSTDGLIERRRGAGTFVRSKPVPRDLGSPLSFTGSMRARGMTTSSQILEWGECEPNTDEMLALDLPFGSMAHVLLRLRFADKTPMAIERVVMPSELASQLDFDFEKVSLHDAFRSIGRRPTEAHAEVGAGRANKNQRDLLGLPQSGVVISELRTIYDQDHVALERTKTTYAADRYAFTAIVREVGE